MATWASRLYRTDPTCCWKMSTFPDICLMTSNNVYVNRMLRWKINKQIKSPHQKQTLPDIIHSHQYDCRIVQLHTFFSLGSGKIWGKGSRFIISSFLRSSFLNLIVKKMKICLYLSVIVKIKVVDFFETRSRHRRLIREVGYGQ